MHKAIRARLEEYLDDPAAAGRKFEEHLSGCGDCRGDLEQFRKQSAQVRLLRSDEASPVAGFYGRVMARIEAEARPSAWSLMHDAAFGWRIALASAGMALIMAGYMVSTDPAGRGMATASDMVMSSAPKNILAIDSGSAAQMDQARNSVLVTLASFQE
ncbi:MAG TPA: zf-HC2 domain-containing protein [Bryobacteraceae bacterium]|jgi:hypothetical protein|nr:zf-HC2 domain-containing protein [Bryobacteraceae bacterium]